MRKILSLFLLFIALPSLAEVTFDKAPLDIRTKTGTLHYTVEVAADEAQHEHGLMFRRQVPDLTGMIFIFPSERHVEFWMKDTLVPLDMLFVDDRGTITQVVENAPVQSLDPIPSTHNARAVIEVAGGSAALHHIGTGDTIIYPLFQ